MEINIKLDGNIALNVFFIPSKSIVWIYYSLIYQSPSRKRDESIDLAKDTIKYVKWKANSKQNDAALSYEGTENNWSTNATDKIILKKYLVFSWLIWAKVRIVDISYSLGNNVWYESSLQIYASRIFYLLMWKSFPNQKQSLCYAAYILQQGCNSWLS